VHFDLEDQRWALQLFERLRQASAAPLGVTRESYGAGENRAHELVAEAGRAAGLRVERDGAANLVVTLPGREPDAPFVACGSHLDSVPEGGNYDGAAGVFAALVALRALHRAGVTPRRSIRVFALRGEESAWFGKCYLGSSALFGVLEGSDLERTRRDGATLLGAAMASCGADVERIRRGETLLDPAHVSAYLELHIEQGPVLEDAGSPVGLVTAIRGNTRYLRAQCLGAAGHSGTTPRELRRDAVFAFCDFVTALDRRWDTLLKAGSDLVVTAGMCGTDPAHHSASRVPDRVDFALEYRSVSREVLERFDALAREASRAVERRRGVELSLGSAIQTPPATMDAGILESLEQLSAEGRIRSTRLASGAGHDASVFAAQGIPSGMIFVRNQHGSHNPDEAMRDDDFMAGTRLLCAALLAEANRDARDREFERGRPIRVRPTIRRRRASGGR